MKKKVLSILLIFAMVLSFVPSFTIGASAAPSYTCYNASTNVQYETLDAALDSAENDEIAKTGDTIVLTADTKLTKTTGVKPYITIDLCGYDVELCYEEAETRFASFYSGVEFTFLISCEKDLHTAAKIAEQEAPRNFTWKLKNDITVSETVLVSKNYLVITVDGNGKTITATNSVLTQASQSHVFSFENSNTTEKTVVIKNLKIVIGNGFRGGILFHRNTAGINATLDGVFVKADRTVEPTKEKSSAIVDTTGTLIQVNGCALAIDNSISLITDSYCWNAIDVDAESGAASVTIPSYVDVTAENNRTAVLNSANPFIGLSNGATADIAANGLTAVTHDEFRTTGGYDLSKVIIENSEGTSVYEDFNEAMSFVQSGDTVELCGNVILTQNLTLPYNVTLKLNGNKIDPNGKTHNYGYGLVFEVASGSDLKFSNWLLSNGTASDCTFKLTEDITVSERFFSRDDDGITSVTIDGQGHKITAEVPVPSTDESVDYVLYFQCNGSANLSATVKDLSIEVKDGFRHGIQFQSGDNNTGKLIAELDNVSVVMNRTISPLKIGGLPRTGGALVNNAAKITVKNELNITTDQFTYAAIDLTGKNNTTKKAELIFTNSGEDKAVVSLADYRSATVKDEEPIVGTENSDYIVVEYSDVANIYPISKNANGLNRPKKNGFVTYFAEVGETQYKTFEEAVANASADSTITVLNDTALAAPVTLPDNTTIVFNSHKLTVSQTNAISGTDTVFEVSCGKDLDTVLDIINTQQKVDLEYTIKLTDNIETSNNYYLNCYFKKLIFDGNNYKITAKNGPGKGVNTAFLFNNSESCYSVEMKDITIEIGNHYRSGINFQSAGNNDIVLDNVTVIMNRTKPAMDGLKLKLGIPLQNNGSHITVKNALSITTDEFCWGAINMDKEVGEEMKSASMTFDTTDENHAVLTFVDNRPDAKKAEEPIFGIDNYSAETVVTGAEDCGLVFVAKGGLLGKNGYEIDVLSCVHYDAVKAGKNQLLVLGNVAAQTFDITGNTACGFVLSDNNGKYLGFNKGAIVAESEKAYTWKYDGGLYAEVKTTTRSGSLFWSRTVTTVTKYYLGVDNGELVLSNNKTAATVRVIGEHTPEYVRLDADNHQIVCKVCNAVICTEKHTFNERTHKCKCGAYDPTVCCINNVYVTYRRTVSFTGFGFWKRASYSYQFTVKPIAQFVGVKSVMISADGVNWKYGTTFTGSLIPATLYIKVIDTNKVETKWKWDAKTNKVTKDELYVTIGGTQYAIEDGWTWNDFVTNYSSVGFATYSKFVLLNGEALKEMASAVFPKPTDTIVAFVEYKLMAE